MRIRNYFLALAVLLSVMLKAQNCTVYSLPYSENFDGNSWVPGSGFFNFINSGDTIDSCWFRPSNTIINKWGSLQTNFNFYTGPTVDASGTGKFIGYESNSGGATLGIIRSPSIAIVNANQPYLYFKYYLHGADIGTLTVSALSKRTGALVVLKTKTGQRQANKTSPWLEDSVSLLQFSGDTIQVTFGASALGFASDMAIDEVEVKNLGINCGAPRFLTQTAADSSSMTLTWLSTNVNSQSKLRWYNVINGPSSIVDIPNVSSPYTLTGLQPGNDYVIRIIDSCGSQLTNSIAGTFATVCVPVLPDFTSVSSFLGVNFTSLSQNADSIIWTFDTLGVSQSFNPNYIFPKAGLYSIQIKVFNECGQVDSLLKIIEVCDTLEADFSREFRNDSVVYIANPQNKASAYFWDLDDGFTGSGDTISVKYTNFNAKTVSLLAINNCVDSSFFSQNFPSCLSPKADWTYTILNPINAGLRIGFNASLSRNANSYIWDFGDGNSDTGIAPVHIYNVPSLNYVVTLKAINRCGELSVRTFPLNQLALQESRSAVNLEIFPNPNDGLVFFNKPAGKSWRWTLYNVQGKIEAQGNLNELAEGFVLPSNVKSGMYQLLINDAKGSTIHKTSLRVD
jgi:PKD repeat protein